MWRRYREVRRRPGVLRISWGVLCALHRASKKWHLAAPGGSSSLKNLYSYPSYDLRFRTQRNVQGTLPCVPCRMALRGSRAGIYALRGSRAVTTMNRRCGQHGAPRRSRRIIGTHTNHCTTRKRTETPMPDLAGTHRDPRLGLLGLLLGLGHTEPSWTDRRRVHGSSGRGPTPADTPIPDLQPIPLLRGLSTEVLATKTVQNGSNQAFWWIRPILAECQHSRLRNGS